MRLPQTPSTRLFYITAAIIIGLGLLLTACTRPVTREAYPTFTATTAQEAPPAPTTISTTVAPAKTPKARPLVTIQAVRVTQGEGIYITGQAGLANGECIQTNLLADGKPAAWWPKDVCVQVDSGQWEMLTSLGRGGAPAKLDPSMAYTLQAWWSKQEQATLAQFPFDLNGPEKP